MKTLITIALFIISIHSCTIDKKPYSFTPYYKVFVNGQETNVSACGTSDYVCQFLKDTSMFASIGCGGQSAGFYLKGTIADGTYNLNNINQAFYSPNSSISYKTNNANTGTLTITTSSLNGISTLKGVFEFKGIDTTTGNILNFINGSFLMKKVQY